MPLIFDARRVYCEVEQVHTVQRLPHLTNPVEHLLLLRGLHLVQIHFVLGWFLLFQ